AGGSKGEVTKDDITATVAAGKLVHFDGSTGVRAELALDFVIEITPKEGSDNKIVISMNAIFDQEVMLSVNVTGGAIWKWAWIFPYIYDYQLNANFDVGTYTGIGVTATAKTVGPGGDDGYDWKPVTGNKFESKLIDIGKQITELMDKRDEFMGDKLVDENGEEIEWSGGGGGGLADKYSAMIENANESWIELFRQEIFSMESSVDPFHILVFGISADFVVSANMYITIGMTFEYANAKRYNFSLMLFHKQTTNETIDLEEEHYQFDFYVMGTLGIRAGIELEVGVGLFSLKLDSIGITAELGAYAQLWGYFYYSLTWSESAGKDSSCSGAMLIDMGIYLKITFKAQLFSSEKLTYQPTLLDKEWPLFTIGAQKNVFDFDYEEKDMPTFDIKTVKSFTLPSSLFDMQYMDMKTGEVFGSGEEEDHPAGNFDDGTESHFDIRITNPAFRYQPLSNTITVNPAISSSTEESGTMYLTWKDSTLAFTSKPISREIPLKWSDPANARYISFNAGGGDAVSMISTGVDGDIKKPADPQRQGYTFAGWFADEACTEPYEFPTKMPDKFGEDDKGITLHAKWETAPNKYMMEFYEQTLNGRFVLTSTTEEFGYTGTLTKQPSDGFHGFTYSEKLSTPQQTVAADGSTVVKAYYTRDKKCVEFNYGTQSEGNPPLKYTLPFESYIDPPTVRLGGYLFDGWVDNHNKPVQFDEIVANEDGTTTRKLLQKVPSIGATYYAKWLPDPNMPYRVIYYIQNLDRNGYSEYGMKYGTGATDEKIWRPNHTKNIRGFDFKEDNHLNDPSKNVKIKADGKTVMELYYDRNHYTATWHEIYDGYPDDVLSVPYWYGEPIPLPRREDPTKRGYIFDGWIGYTQGMTMPANGVDFYPKWLAADVNYTVTHIRQNPDGKTYPTTGDLVETETLAGKNLTYVDVPMRTYEGFTAASKKQNVLINVDSPTSVTYKYSRNKYKVTLDAGDGYIVNPITDYLYGVGKDLPTKVSRSGYDFAHWYVTGDPLQGNIIPTISKWDIGDKSFTAKWYPGINTRYRVEHLTEDVNGRDYTVHSSESLTGRTGDTQTATEIEIAGFTPKAGNVKTGIITGDGNMVIELYYTRNSYPAVWYGDDNNLLATTQVKFEDVIRPPANVNPTRRGHTFVRWDLKGVTTMTEQGALFNTRNNGVWKVNTYSVSFNLNYAGASGAPAAIRQTFGEHYKLPDSDPTRVGYTFDAWFTGATGGRHVTIYTDLITLKDHTLYAHWKPLTDTRYTVKHLTEDLTGGGYTAVTALTEPFTGTTDAAVTATPKEIPGFTAQAAATGNIQAGGNWVLEQRYTRNSYDVTWYDYNTTTPLTTTQVKFGAAIPAPADTNPTREGYTFASWKDIAKTMSAGDISYNANANGNWTANTYSVSFNCN
ncbi:MAG: InlB B-repeat-containing protein, partial [Oscillospiraceae bacterium]